LKNSLNKPPRSGILVVCFQLGCELDQQSLCSGCHRFRQPVEVGLIGREATQAGVRPDGVIKLQVFPDRSPGLPNRLVGVKIDLFIFDRLPHPLDYVLNGSWLDFLDEEFGENNIWSEELLSKWKRMSSRERGSWLLGKLWNDCSILPSLDCSVLDLPAGSTYAQGVRKLKDDWRQELLPETRTSA
jgi:hypothetical protein